MKPSSLYFITKLKTDNEENKVSFVNQIIKKND